jgi:hypothetical protein
MFMATCRAVTLGAWPQQSIDLDALWPGLRVRTELAEDHAVWAESLQRMRQARRKVPQIALFRVRNRWAPLLVFDRDAAVAVSHHRPFRLLVPMEFASAARPEAHVHARDRNDEKAVADLKGLARFIDAP